MIDINEEAYDLVNFQAHQNDQEHLPQQQQQQQHHKLENSNENFKELDKQKDLRTATLVAAQEMQKTASNSSSSTTHSNSSYKKSNHIVETEQRPNPTTSGASGATHSLPTKPKTATQKSNVRINNRGNWTLREDCSLLETLIDHAYSLKIFKKRKYMGKFWLEISSRLSVQYNVLRNTRQCRERFKLLYCNFIKKKVEDDVMLKDDREFPIGTSPSSPTFSTVSANRAGTPSTTSVASYSPSLSSSASSFSNMLNMHGNNQDMPEYKKWLDLLQNCIDIFIYDNENSLDLRSLSNKRPLKLASVNLNKENNFGTGAKSGLHSGESNKDKNFENTTAASAWMNSASPTNSSHAYNHYGLNSGFHDKNTGGSTTKVNADQFSSMQHVPLQTNGAELISDLKVLINKKNGSHENVGKMNNTVYNSNNPHHSSSFPMLQHDSIYQPIPTRANSQPQIEYNPNMNITGSTAYNFENGDATDFSPVSSRFQLPEAATSTTKHTVAHDARESGFAGRADFHLGAPYFGMGTMSPTISHFPHSTNSDKNYGNTDTLSIANEIDPRSASARAESAATMATSCFTKLSSNVFSSNGNYHDAKISLHHASSGESHQHEFDGNASVDGSYQSSGVYADRNNCPSQKSVLEDMQFGDRSPMLIYESSFGKQQPGLDELVTDSGLPTAGCDFFYPYTNFHLFNLSLQQHQHHQQQQHLQQLKYNSQRAFSSPLYYQPSLNSLRTPTPLSSNPSNVSEHNNSTGYNVYGNSANSNNGYTNSYDRSSSWNGYSPTLMNNGFFSPPPSKMNFATGISSRLMSDSTIVDNTFESTATTSNGPSNTYSANNKTGTGMVFTNKSINDDNNDGTNNDDNNENDYNDSHSSVSIEDRHVDMGRSHSSTSHLVVPVSANHDHTFTSNKDNDDTNNDNI